MIDTDKYEGHTEGPWLATHDTLENEMGWVINHDGWRVWVGEKETDVPHLQNNRFDSENLNEADARLIADAPLLLAEVKRLQKKNVEIRNEIHVALDNERMRNGANEGWLKALEYVLALMDVQEEEE